jgi:meiotically up-regulated gene 157 (Mug157) protein
MKGYSSLRPAPEAQTFTSTSVERLISEVSSSIADPELAWLFGNCLPNTLDTTISHDAGNKPDTFVITGDIPAMWLRDSAAQVWPFLSLAREDKKLRIMLEGMLRRQAQSVLLDPYANAFYREPVFGHWRNDLTEMRPGVHERKWELDSLAYFVRLSHGYWTATGDLSPFDETWVAAMGAMFGLLRAEQGEGSSSPYSFYRPKTGERPEDGAVPNRGKGARSAPCGLIRCFFRPSDDMVTFPFLVPANAMMAVALRSIVPLLEALQQSDLAGQAGRVSAEIFEGLKTHAIVEHPVHGEIWAYEVDGLGGVNFMDDANVPSLLSLPYLGVCEQNDPLYLRTRAFCLSKENPYFVAEERYAGIGSPHTKRGTIWPMAITMQALTAESDAEILSCLRQLKTCHAGTGFMHESFNAGNPAEFSRPWFAWANTLFGELIVRLHQDRPHLLADVNLGEK